MLVDHQVGECDRCLMAQQQQCIAGYRPAEYLMHCDNIAVDKATERGGQPADRMDKHSRYVEHNPLTRKIRERRSCARGRNIQHFGQRITLAVGQLHAPPPPSTVVTALSMRSVSNGLLTKPLPPAASTSSRVERWISAVATITRAWGSNSRSLVSTSSPCMPRIVISSSTRSGWSSRYCS